MLQLAPKLARVMHLWPPVRIFLVIATCTYRPKTAAGDRAARAATTRKCNREAEDQANAEIQQEALGKYLLRPVIDYIAHLDIIVPRRAKEDALLNAG